MVPEHAFRRYYGIFRVADFSAIVRQSVISSGGAYLIAGENYRDLDIPFTVHHGATLPDIEILMNWQDGSKRGWDETYFQIAKVSI